MSPDPAPSLLLCALRLSFRVVVTVRNECSHVALDLPPRAVVTAFTAGSRVEGVDSLVPVGGVDWSKMEAKIANGLMEFQKLGVE